MPNELAIPFRSFRCDDAAGFELRVIRANDGDFFLSIVPNRKDMEKEGLDPENYATCFGAAVRIRVPMIGGGVHNRLYHALAFLFNTGGSIERADRQWRIYDWVRRVFGPRNAEPPERAARFLEEAVELAQAAGVARERADRITEVVYSRPAGELAQEIGGCGITLLALAEAAEVSADDAEVTEMKRVFAKDEEHFRRRHTEKAEQGIAILPDA